jgi:hypothetical protein
MGRRPGVDQHHPMAASLEVAGRPSTEHAGADHDCVGAGGADGGDGEAGRERGGRARLERRAAGQVSHGSSLPGCSSPSQRQGCHPSTTV